jgi:hypothetical protein
MIEGRFGMKCCYGNKQTLYIRSKEKSRKMIRIGVICDNCGVTLDDSPDKPKKILSTEEQKEIKSLIASLG